MSLFILQNNQEKIKERREKEKMVIITCNTRYTFWKGDTNKPTSKPCDSAMKENMRNTQLTKLRPDPFLPHAVLTPISGGKRRERKRSNRIRKKEGIEGYRKK